MEIKLFGISHKTAPIKIRERYAILNNKLKVFYQYLKNYFKGVIILNTCNRTEIYILTDKKNSEILEILKNLLAIKEEEKKYFYLYNENEAIYHLYRVTASLDSQIIGENEILHQVKEAYNIAKTQETTEKYMNMIFQNAIAIGKLVRTKTEISKGSISIGKIIISMIEEIEKKKIIIIGTGKICEKIIKHLKEKSIKATILSNKNYEKAKELADIINGEAKELRYLEEEIKKADIIISATSAPHTIIKKDDIEKNKEKDKELIIFDLAVPRDVSPEVRKIKDVILFDLEDINIEITNNYQKRKVEVIKAEQIIEREIKKIWEKKKLELVQEVVI